MPPNQSPQARPTYKVRNFEGHIYDVPEENLDAAMAQDERNVVVTDEEFNVLPSVEQPQDDNVFVRDELGIVQIPRSRLAEAVAGGGVLVDENEVPQEPENPESWGKFLARSAKSIASTVGGGLADTASAIYNIPAMIENKTTEVMGKADPNYMGEHDFIPASQKQPLPLIPSVDHAIESNIDEATGGYTETKEGDSLQAGLKTVAAVATPGGLAKGAAKAGYSGASKVLGALGTTNPAGLAGAGAAGVASSEAHNSGYGTAASIGAGLAAGAGVGLGAATAGSAAKSIDVKLSLAKLTGNSPKNINLEAVKAAEDMGIGYANTVVNESKAIALAEQVVSKSPYFGTKYGKQLDAMDKSYAGAVEKSIAKVGDRIIESDSALDTGSMVKDTFNNIKKSVEIEKDALYAEAVPLVPQGVTVTPKIFADEINSVRKILRTLGPSDDENVVLSYLNTLENGIYFGEGSGRVLAPTPVELLVNTKKSLNNKINWNIKESGPKEHLKSIQRALKKQLEAYGESNPEWWDKFSVAEKYYGKYLGDKALASDTLRKKIFDQENPEKILGSLNDISDFKKIGQSLGRDDAGQQFFNSIKRDKLTDLIMGKLVDPKTENVSYNGFAKTMESPKNKELIKYLAGENYKDLENFNTYASAAIKRNQRNPNPSGTGPTSKVIGAVSAAFTGAVAGGAVAGVTAGVAPLAATVSAGYGLTWLINNKTPLRWGIEAAKKQASGDIKGANTLSRRIEQAMTKDLGEDFVRQFMSLSSTPQ